MKSFARTVLRTSALPFFVWASLAQAGGLTLELVGKDGDQPIRQTVYIAGNQLCTDGQVVDATGKLAPRTLLFDGRTQILTIIDGAKQTYRVLDKAALTELGRRMGEARAQAESRMATLPPDRRGVMAAMLERHGLTGDLALEFAPTGKSKTVSGFACQSYRVTNHGQPFSTACLASWSDGPIQKSELAVVHQLAQLLATAAPAMEQATAAIIDRFPGFPIERMQPPVGPLGARTMTLQSIKRGPIAASHFALPKGLHADLGSGPSPAAKPATP